MKRFFDAAGNITATTKEAERGEVIPPALKQRRRRSPSAAQAPRFVPVTYLRGRDVGNDAGQGHQGRRRELCKATSTRVEPLRVYVSGTPTSLPK